MQLRLGALLAASALALLAGCPRGGSGSECLDDRDCSSGDVCARDELCWPAAEVRAVRVTWTVGGAAATAAACQRHPDLYIRFNGGVADDLGFSPVPCEIGQFSIDKLPLPFTRVELGDDRRGGAWTSGPITSGAAALDLAY